MADFTITLPDNMLPRIRAVLGTEEFSGKLALAVQKAIADIEFDQFARSESTGHEEHVKQRYEEAQQRIRDKRDALNVEWGLIPGTRPPGDPADPPPPPRSTNGGEI